MRFIKYSADSPEMNLAFDEALLDAVDSGASLDTLRLWESPRRFVVIGTAQAIAEEADEPNCAADGVPVLRRCSAGGCVLQGPGCLNFSLALRYELHPDLKNLHASYAWILGKLADVLQKQGINAVRMGISDLVVDGKKFSGNAQRRRRNALLHHGTLLYDVDHAALSRYLREPVDRPEYRGERNHADFVTPLSLSNAAIHGVLCHAFGTDPRAPELPNAEERAAAEALAREKYTDPAWTRRR